MRTVHSSSLLTPQESFCWTTTPATAHTRSGQDSPSVAPLAPPAHTAPAAGSPFRCLPCCHPCCRPRNSHSSREAHNKQPAPTVQQRQQRPWSRCCLGSEGKVHGAMSSTDRVVLLSGMVFLVTGAVWVHGTGILSRTRPTTTSHRAQLPREVAHSRAVLSLRSAGLRQKMPSKSHSQPVL